MQTMKKLLKAMFFFLKEGNRLQPPRWSYMMIIFLSVGITLFGLWLGLLGTLHPLAIGMIFLPVIYFIAFQTTSAYYTLNRLLGIDYVFAFLSLGCGIYFYFNIERYSGWMVGLSRFEFWDKVFSAIFVLLTLELMRRCIGFGLSIVVYALLAYTFLGNNISGTFSVHKVDTDRFLQTMTVSLDGIFGQSTLVAVTYAFLFVLFGHLFQKAGGGQLFFDLSASLAGRRIGGPAKVAVVSSGLFGMVSGSPVADVMTTGPVTIPMMKKVGYPARFAAAAEAAAASGGSILPPIMGSVVFLMVAFTGIPYAEIAKSALFIALLYYFAIYMQVHYISVSHGLGKLSEEEISGLRKALVNGWPNIMPFVVLLWLIFNGNTPSLAATLSIFALFICSWFKKETRLTGRKIIEIFVSTCISVAPLIAAVATAGIVMGCLLLTGLAGKVASLVSSFAGDSLLLTALLTMVITVIFGMGMPTISVYVLAAGLLGPVLVDMGVNVMAAHLFIVYYASMSAITPPVCVACFAAATIANAHPMDVGLRAVRLSFVAFIIPFFFLYEPVLLMQGEVLNIVIRMILSVLGVYLLVVSFAGWIQRKLLLTQRLLAGVTGFMLIVPVWWVDILALAMTGLFWLWYKKGQKSEHAVDMKLDSMSL